ncbi:hypothetical protein Pmani_001753 [Petrolisthes manimaculis]|uniref:Uncharacterized protein n=1 Tax=Petrolisthes manimaculis TaxID=1843537 RepID=A0AAE1UK02_9EUCA|nr:hypothetical protein Pmani_001753 [Petrolisthes manimaculis]
MLRCGLKVYRLLTLPSLEVLRYTTTPSIHTHETSIKSLQFLRMVQLLVCPQPHDTESGATLPALASSSVVPHFCSDHTALTHIRTARIVEFP